MFEDYLWIIWIFSSFLFVRFYVYLVISKFKLIAKPLKERFGTPRIIFQVTTKGNIPIVQDTINRVNAVCKEINYKKYELWAVTDAQESFDGCRTIIVPPEYSCNAIYKGRALQYAVEIRRNEQKNNQDTYIFHLDDESMITKQTLCSILTYLENDPKPISEGLITYPVKNSDQIKISNLMDTLRPFCCFECLQLMNKGKPAYIHGSNLLVRSDIEENISWENGKTLAEDTLFALKARKKYGSKIFGWHGGVIEEKSPLSFNDLIKQRKRWFYGLIQNLKYLSKRDRFSQSARAIIWTSGFLSGIISFIALIVPQSIPDYFRVAFSVTSIMWLLSYQIGVHLNGRHLSLKKKAQFHFLTFLFSILIGLIECITPLIAVLNKPKTFEVIKK